MFTFKSADNEDGKARKRRFLVEIHIYALETFKIRSEMAAYLGITTRGLRDNLHRFPELHKYMTPYSYEDKSTHHFHRRDLWGKKHLEKLPE